MADRPFGRFRIVRGSKRDVVFGRGLVVSVYREGWWWACQGQRGDGLPFDPEGAFETKESAIRHLRATLAQRERHVGNIRWCDGRTKKRPTMRPISCNRVTPAQHRAELASWGDHR